MAGFSNTLAQLQSGLAHQQAGRLADAEAIYRQVLQREPGNVDALHLLGLLANQVGQHAAAVDLIGRAARMAPFNVAIQVNLGTAMRMTGNLSGARECFQRVVGLRPDLMEGHANLGSAFLELGEKTGAIECFKRAVALAPNVAELRHLLGVALAQSLQWEAAANSSREAIRLAPTVAKYQAELAHSLRSAGKLDEAVAALRQAVELAPRDGGLNSDLIGMLREAGRLDEALELAKRGASFGADPARELQNLGVVQADMGFIDEALVNYRKSVELDPASSILHSGVCFAMMFHPASTAEMILREHQEWNRRHVAPLARGIAPHANDRTANRRLRIGYVSFDMRDHVVGRNMVPLFENHDAGEFEIFCYTDVARPDAVTDRIKRVVHHWRSTIGVGDARVAEMVREDQIDILVDLHLHTAGTRLGIFARKPAPVQVTFAGYPGTTGAETIDWRLTDPHLDPPGASDEFYTEKSWRLPDTFWCYDPLGVQVEPGPLPAIAAGHVTFGCMNNIMKVSDVSLALWARVLKSIERSRIRILSPEGVARKRVVDFFVAAGIEAERVEFADRGNREKYLQHYRGVDIALDPLPYNGHTTSLDALWMGVPVVTLPGQTVAGRAGVSQLMNVGMPELIAKDSDDFVAICARLAGDLEALALIRQTLRGKMERSPLMDAKKFARGIEAAYREFWKRWCEQKA